MDKLISLNKYFEQENIQIRFSILKEFSFEYICMVLNTIESIMQSKNIEIVNGKGCRKHLLQKYKESFEEFADRILKYTTYYQIADGRNSFSKTDHSATFMHMKYDYYNHTNVFKPGYNVQMGSSDGYIRHVYVLSDCNDMNTFIPFMNGYKAAYGVLPTKTPADAGYGSYDNYT